MADYSKTYFMQEAGAILFLKSSYNENLVVGYQDTADEGDVGEWTDVDFSIEKGLEHMVLRALVNILIQRFKYSMSDIINIVTTKGDLSKWKRGQG